MTIDHLFVFHVFLITNNYVFLITHNYVFLITQPVSDIPYNDEFEDSVGDEEIWRRKILAHNIIRFLATPLYVFVGMTYETIIRFQAQKLPQ